MLAILEYGAGNQTSVRRALEHLGIPAIVTDKPEDLDRCSGIIFPGVGQARQAMNSLRLTGLDSALASAVAKGQPLLGICLGCQILLEHSEESDTPMLGLLQGRCVRFQDNLSDENGNALKIPHMGWNRVKRLKKNLIWNQIPDDAEFYFVHGYYTSPNPGLRLGQTSHGIDFCSVYGRDGLWAAQFHPEKSGRYGLRFLANFSDYCQERANAI